jgi:lipopolysaccharide/colanic/teichoic acid biosynthesis glycosyltransferase
MTVCALLVRLTSRGPILFRQVRVGYMGHLFALIKFRTMIQGAEAQGAAVVVDGDCRLTPVGAFLRRTKLDELPQLVNVLLGEMSLVGPRPRVPSEVDLNDPQERTLLRVRPGLTSPASIHHRMEADYCAGHPDPQAVHRMKLLPQKLCLDGEYVQNPTLWRDLKLMAITCLLICTPGRCLAAKHRSQRHEMWPTARGWQLALDLVIYAGAAWLAYRLRYEAGFPDFYRKQMWLFMIFVPPVRVIINWREGVYDLMWRYINLVDACFIAMALAPLTLVLFLLRLWLPISSWEAILFHIPLSVATLEYLIALSTGVALRSLRQRLYFLRRHYQPLPEAMHRVLILGAGLLGSRAAIDMRQYPHMTLVGFLDDDPAKQRKLLAGCRVLGTSESLQALWARRRVSDLLVCAKSIEPARIVELARHCSALGIKLQVLPSLGRLLRNEDRTPLTQVVPTLASGNSAWRKAGAPDYPLPQETPAKPSPPWPRSPRTPKRRPDDLQFRL